jgi:calnexin
LEQFTEEGKWIASESKKIVDGIEDEDLLQYKGEWKIESAVEDLIDGDKGLVLKTLAAHSVFYINSGNFGQV